MKRPAGRLLFPLFVAAVLGGLALLSSRGSHPPPLPDDGDHRTLSNDHCDPCHGPRSPSPLKKDHPPKPQCLTCHESA